MDIQSKVDFHLDHLERLAPALVEADADRRNAVAWSVAVEYGFLRRYLDAAADFEDPDDPAYVPEQVETKMESIQEALQRAELSRYLPASDELLEQLESLCRQVLQSQVAEEELARADEAHPNELAGLADPSRQVIEEADEVLSVARTESALGADIPADLFAQALRLARRLREALAPDVLNYVMQKTEAEAAERLVALDDYGEFLWLGFRDPEMQTMLLRKVGRRKEESAGEGNETVVVLHEQFDKLQSDDGSEQEKGESDAVVLSLERSTERPEEKARMAAHTGDSVPDRAAEVSEWDGPGRLFVLTVDNAYSFLYRQPEDGRKPDALNIKGVEGFEGQREWLRVGDADVPLWQTGAPVGAAGDKEYVCVEFSCGGSSLVIELPEPGEEQ